jgi:hypothetical protein
MENASPASPTIALSLDNRPFPTTTLSYLSSRAKPRDLQFSSPATDPGWKRHPSRYHPRVIVGPTYEDENGFYSATSLPGGAALPFVISTGAERSLCGCLFLEMFFDGASRTTTFHGTVTLSFVIPSDHGPAAHL